MNAYEKFLKIRAKNNSILCVGLDTSIDKLPVIFNSNVGSMLAFNKEIINATKDLVCAFKINFAFYEQYGIEGMEVLEKTIALIPDDIFIIADAKRGDIGNTSKAYAKSVFEYFGADSITVNPYMGRDSVEPFLDYTEKFVFLLALTSNPGSNDFQRLEDSGKPVYFHVISKSSKWSGVEQLGYVCGATHPSELKDIRELIPENLLLIPGIGAQGGDVDAVLEANSSGPAIINSSRAIIYASNGKDFAEKARLAAERSRAQFNVK